MLYIEDYDEVILVFNNLKVKRVRREDIERFSFNEVSRSVKYDGVRGTFSKGFIVNKFELLYKGDKSDIKTLKCSKVLFKVKGQEIGSIIVNKPLEFKEMDDGILLRG